MKRQFYILYLEWNRHPERELIRKKIKLNFMDKKIPRLIGFQCGISEYHRIRNIDLELLI